MCTVITKGTQWPDTTSPKQCVRDDTKAHISAVTIWVYTKYWPTLLRDCFQCDFKRLQNYAKQRCG